MRTLCMFVRRKLPCQTVEMHRECVYHILIQAVSASALLAASAWIKNDTSTHDAVPAV